MANSNLTSSIQSSGDALTARINDRVLTQALSQIYSNKNLALQVRQFTGAATLDVSDAVALCSNGPFTVTLPKVNSWSTTNIQKTPILYIINSGAIGTVTIAPQAGEFITGITSIAPGTGAIFFADGNITWLSFAVPNLNGVYVVKTGDSMSGALTNGGNPEVIEADGSPVNTTNTQISLKQGTIAAPKTTTTYKTPALYVERHTNNSSTTSSNNWGNAWMEPTILSETVVYGSEQGSPTGFAARVYTAAAKPAGTPGPLNGISCLAQSNPGAAANNRDVYAANFIAAFSSGNKPSALVGIEVDLIPAVSSGTAGPWVGGSDGFIGVLVQSANNGTQGNAAFYASEAFTTSGWQYGYAAYAHFYSNVAYFKNVYNNAAGQGLYVETAFAAAAGRVFQAYCNGVEYFRISGDTNNPVSAVINGSLVNLNTLASLSGATFTGHVGIGSAPDATASLEVYVTSNSLQIPAQIRNDQAGSGVAGIGFNVASTAAADTSVCKAGIGLQRGSAQGVGDLIFYNRSATDTLAFTAADERMRITSGGLVGIGRTPTTNALEVNGGIVSVSPSVGVGYMTGAGGTVTQLTSKTTGVSLNANCGTITLNGSSLAAGATATFTFTNTSIAATDVLILNHVTTGTFGAYTLNANCAAGSASISVRNNTAGALAEAIVIRFAVIKGVTA